MAGTVHIATSLDADAIYAVQSSRIIPFARHTSVIPSRADLFVADQVAPCALLGKLDHAISAGLNVPAMKPVVLVHEEVGARPSEETVTLYDLAQTGVLDSVFANHAYAAAQKAGLGREFHA